MLVLKIEGKNISKFIKRLYDNKIKLYKINNINDKEIIIYIDKKDYEKIKKIKTIYKIDIINKTGLLKYKEVLYKNINIIISFICTIITLYILSNITLNIEIITNNNTLKENIKNELIKNNINIYKIKKNYKNLYTIKNNIISKYRNNIEWLELEYVGTKCVVKLEERIKSNDNYENEKRNIISLKDATIMKVEAKEGVIVKRKGESVKKGEVIISGKVNLNNVSAQGKVMGEVWYKTKVSFPLTYYEEKLTGKKYTRYSIELFNKKINLFKKKGKIEQKPLLDLKYLKLYKNTIYEKEIIDNVYNYDEAIEQAMIKGRNKIKSKLKDDEHIIYEKCLKVSLNNSKIELEIFYAVYENITGYERIEENG